MYSKLILSVVYVVNLINHVQLQICGEQEDCVVSGWNKWSECTQTCGDHGTRTRSRTLFRDATCGGICPYNMEETEPCNRKCCPVDCTFTSWSKWEKCHCTEEGCDGSGERFKCSKMREKLTNATCGGYCDEQTTIEECGYLCCMRNCILGFWTKWSSCDAPCEQQGLKRRTREVIEDTACGGKQCGHKEEFTECTGDCCPTHCVLGDWGEWSSCNTTCGQGTQIRERFVQLPECGGDLCAEEPVHQETKSCTNFVNVDCVLSAWSAWSSCFLDNGFCGDGTRFRERAVVTSPVCNGTECGNLTETRICYGPCCRRDCKVTEWSEWGFCSSSCGQGVSNRTRSVETWPDCGGALCPPDLLEARGCVVTEVIDCEFTEWSDWTACSNDCGEGIITRSRQMITPAYCGGTCQDELTDEERACESYTARRNCEVSPWGEWSPCVRNCEGGVEKRNKSLVSDLICGGTPCPSLTETRFCHETCEQLCTDGICSCEPGYRLNVDNCTCSEIICPSPLVDYCPETHRYFTDCRYPAFTCSSGHSFNQTCIAYCTENNWTLKGSPQVVMCSGDGTWTQALIYCVRPNKPPIGIQIDKTEMNENIPDNCFAYLSTVTSDDEKSEMHSYSVTSDSTQRLYVKDDRVCLTRTANYEEKPDRWEATFRSTDMEGKYIEETFTFNVLDANDPPSSVKLEPDTIPENSLAGTVVGCFVGTDDDPGQSLTYSMVNSLQKTFMAFDENGRTCVKVIQNSQPLCATDGGNYCVLNREKRLEHRVTVRVTDDGSPPLSAIFDVPIFLSDANDKHTAVKISPDMIPENVEAGEALVKLVTEDEDRNQIYTYRIVSDTSDLFSINGDHLTASRIFDYEKERDSLFEIEVESTDDATPPMTITSAITMKIKDVNEAPIRLQVSSLNGVYPFDLNAPRVPENLKGVMGTIMVQDQDFDDLVEIYILNNEKINNLSISSTTCTKMMSHILCRATISIETPFNYEQENMHTYSFIATDRAGETSALNITLEVINMNDPPTAIFVNGNENHVIEVPENELNYKIGDLSASDDDTADKHEFKITEPVGGLFLVEGNLLKTSKSRVLDFEHQDLYDVVITVTDDGEPRQSTHFHVTIRIVDVNEAPTSTVLSNTKIKENSLEGSIVGTLSTTDPDNVSGDKQTFLYTLSDDSLGRFQLQGGTLMVRKSPQLCGISTCKLDFEEEESVTVKIITVDNGIPRMQREDKFVINIEDANDPPTDVRIDTNMIKEIRPVGTFIGTLSAADVNGDTVTFELQNFIDVFEIQDGNKLVSKQPLDYERLNNYRLAVLATDNGDPQEQSEERLVIKVVDVNEAPVLLNVSTTLSVREDTDVGATVVTWSLSDPDSDEDITVSLTDYSNTFSISPPSCKTTPLTGATDCTVKLVQMVQVYITDDIVISVTVSDKEGLTSSETVYVNIQDVNVRPTNILLDEISNGQIHVPENTRGTIAILTAVDKDPEQSHTFRIVADPSAQFEIEGNQLKTKLTAKIDFENSQGDLTLEIEVTDSGEPPLSYRKTITVIVVDINEPPTTATFSQEKILENSAEGTVVCSIAVTDPDIGQTHTMILVNDDKGRFMLEENVLKIADAGENCLNDSGINCKLNFEKKSVYTVAIQVTDSGSPPMLALFTLHVDITDMNERPRNLKISNNMILIGSPGETVIGFLYSEDEDKDQTHSFELLENSPYVKISKSGQVTVVDSQNLNEGQILDLSIRSTDDGIPQLSSEDIIQIVAVQENVLKVTIEAVGKTVQLERSSIEVEEDTIVGNIFAKLAIEYPKQDQKIRTRIVTREEFVQMDTPDCENINGQTKCEMKLNTQYALDYERKSFFDVTFETTTDDTKSLDSFRIYVKDINEAPLAIYFGSEDISVSENSQSQLLGQFSVTDPDMNDTHTFTIIKNSNFVITEDGRLYTSPNAKIDFESKTTLSISVTVRDRGALEFSQEFPVSVNDLNEAPTGISLSNTKISEMSKNGSVIGTFIVSDPDIEQSHSFDLLSDQGRFIIEGSRLLVGDVGLECITRGGIFCSLDFESKTKHNVTVKVTDSGAIRLSAVFVITVHITDVNDPPRAVSISANKVLEDTDVGEIIAKLDATDDDVDQALTFLLKDNTFFGIEGQNVILLKQLDFETSADQIVEVVVMDNGLPSLTVSAVFNISIVDVNEPPVSLLLRSTVDGVEMFDIDEPAIVENMPALTYIGQVVAIDSDRNDDIYIESLTSDIVVTKVECIPVAKGTRCTADVRSGRVFDFEREELVNVSFICTDRDGLQLRKKMTLQILDANDPPTNIYINGTVASQIAVPENSRGILLAKLTADDIEKNQNYSYALGGETLSLLVQNDELWITSAAVLDFEANDEIPFTIRVTDSGSPPRYYQKEIVLNITDVNEAPTDLYLTSNTVPENASEGYSVGSFVVIDPENLNNGLTKAFTYKLSNEKSMFKVSDNLLMVAVPEFDYEKRRYFEEVVVVSDNGTPMMSATFSFTLEVTDVNEPPTHLEFNGDAVEEIANIGAVVGKLSARDPDKGQSFVFSVIGTHLLSVNGDAVVVNGPLDFEAVRELKFSACVMDNGSPSLLLKKDYIVSIVDVNEPPTDIVVFNNDDMTISEGSRTNEAVANIKIFDADLVERLQLEIVYGKEIFKIAPAGLSCSVEIGDKFSGTVCTTGLHLIKEQDYEFGPRQIALSVIAQDKGGLTLQRTFSFSVVNINETPKDIIIETDIEYVPENTPNFVIGSLSTVDDDMYESYTYIVVTPWDVFSTSGDKLIAKSALNFENQDTYTVSVRSQDNSYRPMFLVKDFKISVGDVNEKPSDIEIIPTEIARETAIGDIIAEIHITDPDNFGRPGFQTHTCHVSPEEYFQIYNSELVVKVVSSLSEDLESFNITISCTDSGEPPLSVEENITIFVVENVDVPKVVQLLDMSGSTEVSVEENVADIAVGKLTVVNLLTKHPIQGMSEFSLSETSQDLFEVKGDILQLTKEVDFELSPVIYIEIFARGSDLSGYDFQFAQNITVKVIDINEAPTGIDIGGNRSVTENVAEGTIIGDLSTYDAEKYQNYTYSLLGVNYGRVSIIVETSGDSALYKWLRVTSDDIGMLDAFEIDDGVLKVGRAAQYINYEKSDVISVLINTRDSGDPSYDTSRLVHLVIENADDPPSDISLSNSVISENSPVDTVIGSVSVSDEDGLQQATCEILNLIDVPFKISERSLLVVAKDVLDFETRTSYSVEISCGNADQDGTSLKFTKAIVVNITNVNEPPLDIVLSSYRVEENNYIGQVIAEIRAIDLDSEVVLLSTEDIDSTSFDLEENATLVAKTEFNFEEKQFHKVTIKAVDDDGEYIMKDFEIEVLDVNEAPTTIQLDNKIVPENAESSSIVGRLSSLDPDWNQEFMYTLDKNTAQSGILEISGASLIIGEYGLDFETASSHRITVSCTDNGIPPKTTEQDFLIEVVDANDPPAAIIVRMVDTVPENAKINSLVASFEVDDPDTGQIHACHILNGEEFISIRMTADSTAEMVLVNELNYEESDTLDIVLSCTDGEFKIKKEYTIEVVDVNEAPTAIKLSGSNTVLAAAPKHHVIGILTAEDEDFGQSHTFTISGQNSNILNVSLNNELILLEGIPSNVLDSLDPSLSFTVSVADNGIPFLMYTQTFTLPITLVSIQVNRLPTTKISTIELLTTMRKGKVIDRIFSENLTLSLNIQPSLVKNPYNVFTVENNTFLVLAIDVQNIDLSSFTFDIQIEDVVKMEKETKSVTVFVKRDFTCFESMQNCEENEVCVKFNETYHMCNCINDFNRTEDGICVRVNHCEVNQEPKGNAFIRCLNGGTCIDDVDDYNCNCVEGFVGKHCEIDKSLISSCSPSPCLNRAECLQDSDGSFHCACRNGWTGSICQDSIDDCTDATCFHGGTCMDKHLTYLCACGDAWKGLRCEYHVNVCSEIFCNKSNICVGLVSSNRSLCVETEKYVVDLEYDKLHRTDIKTMQALLVYFIIKNGQFPVVTVPADRRRRDISHNEIQIYVTDAQERMEKYHFSFVVIDETETPLPRDAVLTTLSLMCLKKNDSDLTEDIFCPSIIQALKRAATKEELSDKLNSGVIVGLTLAVLLLILCATAYIFWKKKKPNTVKPENTGERVPNGSRAGYATMPMQSCVQLSDTDRQVEAAPEEISLSTTIIQVAPAQDDNAYSSVV